MHNMDIHGCLNVRMAQMNFYISRPGIFLCQQVPLFNLILLDSSCISNGTAIFLDKLASACEEEKASSPIVVRE
jgi:hypothetical protein